MQTTTTTTTTTAIGKGCGAIFFSLFAIAGGFVLFFLCSSLSADWKTRSWSAVDAVLLGQSPTLEKTKTESRESVPFRYEFQGRTYTRDTVTLPGSMAVNGRRSATFHRLSNKPAGTKVKCFVNPEQPSEAVLEHRSLGYAWFLLLPVVFLLVGLGGMYFVIRAKPASEKPASERHESPANSKSGIVGLRIFGSLFMLVGGLAVWFVGVKPMLEARAAGNWQQVPCKIESARVTSYRGSKGSTSYNIDVAYRYEFDGQQFTGDRYGFSTTSSSSRAWRDAAVRSLRNDPTPVCFVNPSEPSESVLSTELGSEKWFTLIPLIFFAVGLGIFLAAPKLAAKSGGARGLPRPLPAQHSVVSLAHGGFELRPGTTPKAACAAIGCFMIFWNGIVWTIFLQPELPTVARAFLMIFVLVGLGLLGGFGYFLLSMFNPKATVISDAQAVQLGQSLKLKWKFDGNTSRISHLEITLTAKESATYRRGTNSTTDHQFFVHQQIFETRDRASIATGEVTVHIPADSMHSFDAPNNKVVWAVKLHGDIAKWPNVNLEFPITVLPV